VITINLRHERKNRYSEYYKQIVYRPKIGPTFLTNLKGERGTKLSLTRKAQADLHLFFEFNHCAT